MTEGVTRKCSDSEIGIQIKEIWKYVYLSSLVISIIRGTHCLKSVSVMFNKVTDVSELQLLLARTLYRASIKSTYLTNVALQFLLWNQDEQLSASGKSGGHSGVHGQSMDAWEKWTLSVNIDAQHAVMFREQFKWIRKRIVQVHCSNV